MLVAASSVADDDMPTHELRGPCYKEWGEYRLSVPNYGNSTGCISPATVNSRRPLYEAHICCSNHKEEERGQRAGQDVSRNTAGSSKNERLDRRIP